MLKLKQDAHRLFRYSCYLQDRLRYLLFIHLMNFVCNCNVQTFFFFCLMRFSHLFSVCCWVLAPVFECNMPKKETHTQMDCCFRQTNWMKINQFLPPDFNWWFVVQIHSVTYVYMPNHNRHSKNDFISKYLNKRNSTIEL